MFSTFSAGILSSVPHESAIWRIRTFHLPTQSRVRHNDVKTTIPDDFISHTTTKKEKLPFNLWSRKTQKNKNNRIFFSSSSPSVFPKKTNLKSDTTKWDYQIAQWVKISRKSLILIFWRENSNFLEFLKKEFFMRLFLRNFAPSWNSKKLHSG